jgi:hypothetical protein
MSLNKRKLAREWKVLNSKFETKWFKIVYSSLREVAKQVGKTIEDLGPQEARNRLNNQLINNGISAEIASLYTDVGLFWARRSYKSLREQKAQTLGFSEVWTRQIQDELRIFLIEKVLFSASETTKQILYRAISEGIEQGWSVDRIVREMPDYPGLEYQAARIVRTEVNRAANLGVKTGGSSFRFEQNKVWISVHDHRTRGVLPTQSADHFHMDGQTIPFDSLFQDPRNGHQLEFPGDPKAGPEDTINCRCTMGLVAQRDERGNLIPKNSRISVIRNFNREQRTITI